MTIKENIKAILACNFWGFKDEYIELATKKIMEIIDAAIKQTHDSCKCERTKTDILEQIIAEINSSNRGTCDSYIVDRIEEIINEYQKGGAE